MTGVPDPAPRRGLFKLIADIPTLLMDLVRGEIESFKQEIIGKLKLAGIGIGLLVGAAIFAFFALLVLIARPRDGAAGVGVSAHHWRRHPADRRDPRARRHLEPQEGRAPGAHEHH